MELIVSGRTNRTAVRFGFGVAFILIVCSACKPAPDQERLNWEDRARVVKKHMETYPNFRLLLEKQLKKSEATRAKADKIKDKQKRGETLVRASDMLNNELTRGLTLYGKRRAALLERSRELRRLRPPRKLRDIVKQDMKTAREARLEARKMMRNKAAVAGAETAVETVRKANEKLGEALGNLERTVKRIQATKKTGKKR